MAPTASEARMGWSAGWHPTAKRCESPNFGARPPETLIDLIVVHSISLPPGQYGGSAVADLFCNRLDWSAHPYFRQIEGLQVSAHFYIRRDGTLWQFVSCDDRAWHAGSSMFCGRANCNDYSIGVEMEGLEGERFMAAQYQALAELCAALRSVYPIAHIAGHSDVAPGRKFDPGPGFDWANLQRLVGWPRSRFAPLK